MTNHTPSPETQIDAEGQRIAKAALGIPDTGQLLKPLDLNSVPLLCLFNSDGMVDIHANGPTKEDAIGMLRALADKLEAGA